MHPDDERDSREIEAVLRALDHEPPRVTVEDILVRARRRPPAWRRWAAGIVLALLAAGGAWAAPGSPLPRWIDALTHGPAAGAPPAGTADTRSVEPESSGDDAAGVSVTPGESLVIELRSDVPSAHARVVVEDRSELLVRAPAGSARFRSEPSRLVVEGLGADTLEILIPVTAPRVEVWAGGSRLLLKDGAELTAAVEPEASGGYLLLVEGPGG